MAAIHEIRDKIAKDQFEFSRHAVDQSILRRINVQKIREAIEDGKVIEDYPEDKYGPSCLILGFTGGGKAGARALQPSLPAHWSIDQDHHRLRTEPESMDRL